MGCYKDTGETLTRAVLQTSKMVVVEILTEMAVYRLLAERQVIVATNTISTGSRTGPQKFLKFRAWPGSFPTYLMVGRSVTSETHPNCGEAKRIPKRR
jgi:hypothetical protein